MIDFIFSMLCSGMILFCGWRFMETDRMDIEWAFYLLAFTSTVTLLYIRGIARGVELAVEMFL